jgi:hypothetical protein
MTWEGRGRRSLVRNLTRYPESKKKKFLQKEFSGPKSHFQVYVATANINLKTSSNFYLSLDYQKTKNSFF